MTRSVNNIARLQERMREYQIDSLLVPLGINFRWIFGLLEEPSERLILGIIEAERSSAKLLAPNFEIERMKIHTGLSDCFGWEETQNAFSMLPEILSSKTKQTIGIEPKMWFTFFNKINENLPNNKFVSAEILFNSLRSVKDEDEEKYILKASQKSANAIVSTLNELETGITENEFQKILNERLLWGSKEKTFSLVQFGDNTALPHYHGGNRRLEKDSVVLIDAGGSYNNYWGDITITTFFGRVNPRFKEIYDIVYEANLKAKDAIIQNKLPSEIDAAARNYITKNGYEKYFTHRTGHGLGLEVHEHPYIVNTNQDPLVKGNSFTIEPGIYIPGEFGVRIEDNVIKTPTGINTSDVPRYEIIEI